MLLLCIGTTIFAILFCSVVVFARQQKVLGDKRKRSGFNNLPNVYASQLNLDVVTQATILDAASASATAIVGDASYVPDSCSANMSFDSNNNFGSCDISQSSNSGSSNF